MKKGYINVYELNGKIYLFLHVNGEKPKRYDCWERYDYGDLRKCIFKWLADGVMDAAESRYNKHNEESCAYYCRRIVTVTWTDKGGCNVTPAVKLMGLEGLHAWGVDNV